VLTRHIHRVWQQNQSIYRPRKVWKQLRREGMPVDCCTVQWLMRRDCLVRNRRGERQKTTIPDPVATRPSDLGERRFVAERPNRRWVADIAYISTSSGVCYAALVIDVYSRMIGGWAITTHLRTMLALEALGWRCGVRNTLLEEEIHHSDRGSQYTIDPLHRVPCRSRHRTLGRLPGDSYDGTLAESTIGLYKRVRINRTRPRWTPEEVERSTLGWIKW
jgi:putative transposase